jgi:hypothetical protein
MLLKLIEYIFFLFVLYLLPDYFFSFFLNKLKELQQKIKDIYQKIPCLSIVAAGDELLLAMSNLEGALFCGMIGSSNQKNTLPQFKFYTSLLLKLLEANRQEGIAIRKLIPELRIGVQRDIQFEKKISKVVLGGNVQFLVIALATWGFVFFSQQLIQVHLETKLGLLMALLQLLGFTFLNVMTSVQKKKKFGPFSSAFEELYLFRSLVEVRLPIKVILAESKIMNGVLLTSKMFSSLSKRIAYSVERWRNSGISPKEESEELIKELWYSLEEQFLDFIKKIEILKFVTMALLFLPAYFLYLSAIFKFFMEQ